MYFLTAFKILEKLLEDVFGHLTDGKNQATHLIFCLQRAALFIL